MRGSEPADQEWIAWHPIRESVDALDRIARTDRASNVRQEAAEALGDVALSDAAPVLIALARSLEDHAARLGAVEALGARTEPIAREALESIARQDASVDVQREAVETLGDFKDGSGIPALTALARTHPNVDVRRESIETLGDTTSAAEHATLLKSIALDDRTMQVQAEAIDTLADLPDGSGISALIDLARDHPTDGMRKRALEALLESDHPKARELFRGALRRTAPR